MTAAAGALAALAPLMREVEAMVFAAAEPLRLAEIAAKVSEPGDVAAALTALQASYAARGFGLTEHDGSWRFTVAAEFAHVLARERPVTRPLPRAALATLAVIARHEPVTLAEICEIRGVAVSAATRALLLGTGWIKATPRDAPGRPLHYATTAAFLEQFGLSDRRDLPGLEDLRAAGLLDAGLPGAGLPGAGLPDAAARDEASAGENDAETG
jgi:segregation and condensation protein B